MIEDLLLKSRSADHVTVLSERDKAVFLEEAIDLFTHKRQGHLIHRMYMNSDALAYWSRFMKHDGYYVTRSESILIQRYASVVGDMAHHPEGVTGIENGPGTNSAMKRKSGIFFSAMPHLHTYIGRDWSPEISANIPHVMNDFLPDAKIVSDQSNFLKDGLPVCKGRKVLAEFGLTSGNMAGFPSDPFPRHIFQRDMIFQRSLLDDGDIYVISFDANQDEQSVTYAYTSDWLTQWGREVFRIMKDVLPIEGDFDPEAFVFHPIWHKESHINTNNMVAMRHMEFSLGGIPVVVHEGEPFGITNSYKIPVELFSDIAKRSGFEMGGLFQDSAKRMTMAVLKAA